MDSPPNSADHRESVVYKITNLVNGRIYVGSAKKFERRFAAYRGLRHGVRKANTAIEHAIRKHGIGSFEFEILETPPADSRFDREQHWIDTLSPFDPVGYNLARSARHIPDGCRRPITEHRREAMRESSRRTALRYSEETRKRSSKPVYQIDLKTGAVLAEHPSALEADRTMKLSPNTVNKVCRSQEKHRTAVGYAWCYKVDYDSGKFSIPVARKIALCASFHQAIKPIVMCDASDVPITIWDCAKDILDALGLSQAPILRCCRGEREQSSGYRWHFLGDENAITEIRERRKAFYEANKFEEMN